MAQVLVEEVDGDTLEGLRRRRYLHGQMGDQVDADVIETFKVGTEQLAEAALEAIGGTRR